ncbi:trehalose phosphatase [Pseudomonas neustonica]|uniref:Trehalose phosphatase n=1 Tax=Pseudomonas neustonica TaxID=2487346 RepID=A0ABX9XD04_9PSED|nr:MULTISPECIES: trehalose phosphatase [Pseudomonas]ROZ80234.1 trehalose phosphatase [Pseudomonas sp. SSM44]ROZ80741.1 trehalose phosphatase [Pseudomonas neustonica]|tara:strand:+ start:2319 stop:3074 length:756 start_codon:yes stop_codon:yes gene_type:complete
MHDVKPLVLVDLDDNLFQTARKMSETPVYVASRTEAGEPSGYMTVAQNQLVTWLLKTADVVPITARSIEAFSRVEIPFKGLAVCSHGGVILTPERNPDAQWQEQIAQMLLPYRERLLAISALALDIGNELGHSLRGWVVEEMGNSFYAVIKDNNSAETALSELLAEMRKRGLIGDMYVHINGNNLAFLPQELNKRFAAQEIIKRDKAINGERPVIGLGDSISDLGFMSQCLFWGTPSNSQITRTVMEGIHG